MRRLWNETQGMTPDTALRLAKALPGMGTAGYWMNLQTEHDLWFHEHHIGGALRRIEPLRFIEQDGVRLLIWPTGSRELWGPRSKWAQPGYDHAMPDPNAPGQRR
jgi:hypothetical protein